MSSFLQLLWEAPLVDAAEALGCMFSPTQENTPLQKTVLFRKIAPHLFPQPPQRRNKSRRRSGSISRVFNVPASPLAPSRRERLDEVEARKKLQCEAVERQRRERSKEEILKFVEENRILV
ncbi:hypothetical protein C8R45DRAFT_1092013 [Mycena sanguinolenta]|nr:hypothetical protein C8R45DRAFT_1092013 [Mycena sanguinolenta]